MSQLTEQLADLASRVTWHPDTPLAHIRQFDLTLFTIVQTVEQVQKHLFDCTLCLEDMAAWNEGDQVDKSFDEPRAAQWARNVLATMGISGPLNDEGEPDG